MQISWRSIRNFYQRWLPPIMLLSALVWLGCVYFFNQARPPVGSYIAGLALLVVPVTLWPPESNWSKAAWLAVFFSLTGLELATLFQERAENQKQQAEARDKENQAFDGIAKGLSTSIANNQVAFKATLEGFERTLNATNQTINNTRPPEKAKAMKRREKRRAKRVAKKG